MLNVFIGYDKRESIAYHTLAHSIMRHAKRPVSITPLCLDNLLGLFTRPRENQSTDFSFTRFLVPHLSNYQGWSLYMDCDMLVREDIHGIFERIEIPDWGHDVLVCKHEYTPKTTTKFLGNAQVAYPKKNWSSLMLFNNHKCADKLRPDYVNTAFAHQLHQFSWARSVGSIPLEWNWLVGEYDHNPAAKVVHFTNGTPCFPEYAACDYADEWHATAEMVKA